MLTRVPEEIRRAEKALDFGELSTLEPLKFQFYYEQPGQAISNTIYLEDGNPPLTLYLEVFNDSTEVVELKAFSQRLATVQAGGSQAASATKCHFQLRWEKDLGLKPSEIKIDDTSGKWQVNYDEEDRFFSIYFLHKSGLTLQPFGKIRLGFLKLTANNRTVKSSNVELLYGGKNLVVTGVNQDPIEDEISSRIAVSVINYPGKTQIPLQFRMLGSNKILNDGTSQNTLKLKVINSPLSNNARPILLLDKSSKFIVSFEKGTHADALVATDSQLSNVQIKVTDINSWASDHTANSTQWSFTPQASLKQLTAGQGIELTISQLVTSSASGLACIYIDYQNIGSYPDGRLVIPIEKTPLLYSGHNVGIRNNDPRIHLAIGDNDTGLHQQGDGELAIYTDNIERVRFDKKGNVGIGTTNPAAKLHVNGGNAVISGKVGIGTNDPQAKLHVNDGDAVISGSVGIRTTTGRIDLAIGDDDTGLQQKGDGELAIYTNGIERVRVNASGNVGIGTTTPKAKLHVDGGNAVISGNVGIGTSSPADKLHVVGDLVLGNNTNNQKFIFHSRSGPPSNADFLQITHDNQSGDWDWSQGITLKRGGNVGIGTTSPAAKLDVDGGDAVISGKVGIGTTNPSKGKLHIEGYVEHNLGGHVYLAKISPSVSSAPAGSVDYSIYASARIAGKEFNAFSDLRIKEIKGNSDSQADLETLLQIQVTDYYYKDKIAKGNRPKKKVIGQQIADVYPQAVSTHVDVVPDIFESAIIEENWVTLNSHNLKIGDKIKIFWNDNDSQLFTVEDIKPDKFKISLNHTGDIFVYGREVDDFHVVDYDALSMLHISATQELYKIIKKLNEVLKNQQNYLDRLENKVNELNQKLTAGQ